MSRIRHCSLTAGLKVIGVLAAISSHFPLSPLFAAERVVIEYGIWRQSLPVADITDFCKSGKTTPALESYLRMSKQTIDSTNSLLCKPIPVSGVMLSRMLNNPVGDLILDTFSEIISTPTGKASRESLRGALVSCALENNSISVVKVLEHYPTSDVHLKGEKLLEIHGKLGDILATVKRIRF
ncbi:MAG: alpha/beta hydrolase [Geminocystis sp.]|nr:alpha/beta hydrolase [Geminocystis sp.]HIK38573.1 alpha/beta hydrolase [Geminocystis sp. M7585_C2015_104]MCS7147338.1 alpha/beta hydrolase [Geminocystis sp.]MCX8079080.1 alpha/beta hydrolase [Geminocystis sp.]MDW8116337.1 alpha/beta hydrolase [Geminocystis sp.]